MNRIKIVNGAIILSWLIVAGCKCNNDNRDKENINSLADSSKEISAPFSMDAIRQKDSASIFHNDSMSNALHKLSIQKESWTNARLMDIDTVRDNGHAATVVVDDAFLKKYAPILYVSPNGQFILDLGSDNKISDSATGSLVDGDPETDVYILDKQSGKRMPLLNLGGSGHIVQAHWLDEDKAAVLCTLPGKNPAKDDTYLYVYNVKDQVMKTYKF